MAHGKYVAMVDDDDVISEDYVNELLKATYSDADAICFDVKCSVNGGDWKVAEYSKDYPNANLPDRYLRKPNHLMCVKRELAKIARFPDSSY